VEVLDNFQQGFKTTGARILVAPTIAEPNGIYEVPVRYNMGLPGPNQFIVLTLEGPGEEIHFEEYIDAYTYFGEEEVTVVVSNNAVTGDELSWNLEVYNGNPYVPESVELCENCTTVADPIDFYSGFLDLAYPYGGNTPGVNCTSPNVGACEITPIDGFMSWLLSWIPGAGGDNVSWCTVLNPNGAWDPVKQTLAGIFRAWKLYKGFELGNGKHGHKTVAGAGACEKLVVTSGLNIPSLQDLTIGALQQGVGYTIQAQQQVSLHPPGWESQGNMEALGDMEITQDLLDLGYVQITTGGSNYAVIPPGSNYAVNYGTFSEEDSTYADDPDDELRKRIDWDFDVVYDAVANTITISGGVEGDVVYSLWQVCEASVGGGGSGSVSFSAAGDVLDAWFHLESDGVFQCGDHPCWHGQVECHMGILLEISYPTECTVKIEFTLQVAAGAHAEFYPIGQAFCCPKYEYPLLTIVEDICDDTEVQSWMNEYFPELVAQYDGNYTEATTMMLRWY